MFETTSRENQVFAPVTSRLVSGYRFKKMTSVLLRGGEVSTILVNPHHSPKVIKTIIMKIMGPRDSMGLSGVQRFYFDWLDVPSIRSLWTQRTEGGRAC